MDDEIYCAVCREHMAPEGDWSECGRDDCPTYRVPKTRPCPDSEGHVGKREPETDVWNRHGYDPTAPEAGAGFRDDDDN